MIKRLNGWKSHTLSLAGTVTLAKLALAIIPSYIMQTIKLLNAICNKIDHICKQFFWGSFDIERKFILLTGTKFVALMRKVVLVFVRLGNLILLV